MRRVFLVRHGSHDRLGRILCGRMTGVSLSKIGRAEADAVASRLVGTGAGTLLASPQDRAAETAAPIAGAVGLTVETEQAIEPEGARQVGDCDTDRVQLRHDVDTTSLTLS